MSKSQRQEIVDIMNSVPPSDNWVREVMRRLVEYDPKLAAEVRKLANEKLGEVKQK